MCRTVVLLVLILLLLYCGSSSASASASPPAKIISGLLSNAVSALFKWMWSLKSTPKAKAGAKWGDRSVGSSGRSLMKFEAGYNVETLLDVGALGIESYAVEVSPSGELLLLDSASSNIFKISTPLSKYSRPQLVAGSQEGDSGHVDGKPREARMNHPKGLAVDDGGNIYVADTMNKAIRKISETGVTTIAGGKRGRAGGHHIDGPSEDAKFSSDFDIIYVGSSCSLLVIDRENQAIREIQLQEGDCADATDYDGNFHLGIAVFVGAGFFGYMLALLQYRVRAMFSSKDDSVAMMRNGIQPVSFGAAHKSVRPPFIPAEEPERGEEGFLWSLGRLFLNTGSSLFEIIGGSLFGSKRKPNYLKKQQQFQQQQYMHPNAWPLHESYTTPDEDEQPTLGSRAHMPRENYPVMAKDAQIGRPFGQPQNFYGGWEEEDHYQQPPKLQQQQQRQQQIHRQQQQQRQHQQQQQQHHQQKRYAPTQQAYHEKSCETNEFVFGAVQEQDGRREAVVIKAVDYGDPGYNQRNIRPRINYMGYSHHF